MYKLQLVLYVAVAIPSVIGRGVLWFALPRGSLTTCLVSSCENGEMTYTRASAVCFTPEGSLDTLKSPVANPISTDRRKVVIYALRFNCIFC